eukprot:TRINITY_DN1932_c0_g2_i1.p1 TRINITY_DN1932_c0_g2~~TRINITY_DN1932_c0_g2_i1.p1  ORF type:complete len:1253 (+),score=271.02 TRINITY_DN1932_c0_g2_i1:49-3759(+)
MPREDDMLAAMMGGFQEQAARVDSATKKKPLGGCAEDDFKDLLAGTWSEHGLPPLDQPKEKKEVPRVLQLGEIAALAAGESLSDSSSPIPLSSSPQSSNAQSEQRQVQQPVVQPPTSPYSDLFDILRSHTDSTSAVAALKSVLSSEIPQNESASQTSSLHDIATELYNSCKQSSSGTSKDRCETIEFVKKHYREMHLVPKVAPLAQPVPTDPMEEVIAPDGYNYISNMPSSAARNTLQYLFSDEAANLDDSVRALLQNWEQKLRSNIHAAPSLPGDDVCESPATATINFDDGKLEAAKKQIASANQRKQQLLAGASGESSESQTEWSKQEILAEEWRIREAENTINELTQKAKIAPSLSLPGSKVTPVHIDTSTSPQAISVSGSLHELDGTFTRDTGAPDGQVMYTRIDGRLKLFSDGSKWGFIDQNASTTSSTYAVSTKTESRNPCSVETWYEIDEEKGKYTANVELTVEETTEPMDEGMAMLLGMGFEEEAIRAVWELTGGSVEQAIDILTTQQQDVAEEAPQQAAKQKTAPKKGTTPSPPQSELTRESSLGSLREMFGTLDSAIVDDVVKQYGLANEEKCVLALSELSEFTPQNSTSSLPIIQPPPSQPSSTPNAQSLAPAPVAPVAPRRQFRILPEKGIALRVKQDYSAIERKIPGPLKGEIVTAKTVEPNWIRLEYGYWIPRYKEHKMLLEEVDTSVDEDFRQANILGCELGDNDTEILHAIESGSPQLLQMLLLYRKKSVTPELLDAAAKSERFKQKDDQAKRARRLLVSKMALNEVGNDGMTPLMRCCRSLHLVMAQELLENGADPNIMSTHGSSALSVLFSAMNKTAILPEHNLGLPFEDVNLLTSQLATPITLNTIPDAGEHRGMTILHSALRENKKGRAGLLLSLGADKTIKDSLGYTPLHAALTVPKFEDHANAARILEELIDDKTINAQNNDGNTPLFAAIQSKSRFIDMLLDSGANPVIRNNNGVTPVMYATTHPEFATRIDVFKRLATTEAVKGLPGMASPLHYTMEPSKIEMAKVLLDAGADPKHLDNRQQCSLHYAVSQECDSDEWLELINRLMADPSVLAIQNGDGVSPLHAAARLGKRRVIAALIARGASLTLQATGGSIPLHFAVTVPLYNVPDMGDVINLLAGSRGPSGAVNARDSLGITALHLAAQSSFWVVASHLLEAGARPDAADNSGKLPYQHIPDQSTSILTAFDRSVIQRLKPAMNFESTVPPLPQSPIV